MMESILGALVLILSLVGVISIIYGIVLKTLTPKRRERYITVIPLTDSSIPSSLIGCAVEKRKIFGETEYCDIVAVNCGLNGENSAFIRNMYGKDELFELLSPEDAVRKLENMLNSHISVRGSE